MLFPRFSVGPVPFIDFFAKYAKQWPNAILKAESEYIRDSGLGQLIFRVLPVDGIYWFGLLHLTALMCGLGLIFLTLRRELQDDYVYPVFRIIILGQIGYVLFRWIGSYDAFTFLLWGMFFFFASRKRLYLVLLSAIGLGFQHFEQASIGILGLVLVSIFLKKPSGVFEFKSLIKSFGAIAVGKILLLGTLVFNDHSISGRSNYFTTQFLELGVSEVTNNLPFFIWSLFGAFWIVVINFLMKTSEKRRLIPLILYFAFCVTVAIFARDHSRVFVLTTFPSLLFISLHYLKNHEGAKKCIGRIEILTWVTVPVALWENNLLGSFNLFGEIFAQLTK